MNLLELTVWNKQNTASGEGAKIPWNAPDFSRRMLENHLAQEHDWASRRNEIITKHTAWIAEQLRSAARVLDLGCGPGFYTHKLAELGHHCIGVDFSPASIEYAQKQAESTELALEYALCDIRAYTTEQKFDCILMTFGEFNVFTRQDASAILKNCADMLHDDGLFVLEAHTFDAVRSVGAAPATWQRHVLGLFSEKQHLCLQENSWSADDGNALSQFFIIDAATAQVQQYASFMQAYTLEGYQKMLRAVHLADAQILDEQKWPTGDDFQGKLQTFACRKG